MSETLKYYEELIIKYDKKVMELQQENKQLKERIDKYENPEDMTLMMMWATDKVKDENKQLKDNWNKLKEWLNKDIPFRQTLRVMQELEGGDSND